MLSNTGCFIISCRFGLSLFWINNEDVKQGLTLGSADDRHLPSARLISIHLLMPSVFQPWECAQPKNLQVRFLQYYLKCLQKVWLYRHIAYIFIFSPILIWMIFCQCVVLTALLENPFRELYFLFSTLPSSIVRIFFAQ